MDSLLEWIAWEREEQDRNLRESGEPGYGDEPDGPLPVIPVCGPQSALRAATVGMTEDDYRPAEVDWSRLVGGAPGLGPDVALTAKLARVLFPTKERGAAVGPKGRGRTFNLKPFKPRVVRPYIYEKKIVGRKKWKRMLSLGSAPAVPAGATICDISRERFINLYSGVAFANRCGCVMNAHLTVAWTLLGLSDEEAFDWAFEMMQDRIRDWFGRAHSTPVWMYSNERSVRSGLHTHWLLSVPPEGAVSFGAWAGETFLTRCGAMGSPENAIRLDPISNMFGQWRLFQYLCKGIKQRARMLPACRAADGLPVYLGDLIEFAYEPTWDVLGRRRMGMSDSINTKQRELGYIDEGMLPHRRAPNFKSLLELGVIDVRRLYSDEYYREWERLELRL